MSVVGPDRPDISGELARRIRDMVPAVLATVIEGPGIGSKLLADSEGNRLGRLGTPGLDRVVLRDSLEELAGGTSAVRHYGTDGTDGDGAPETVTVFIESFAPPPRLVIVGAVDFSAALCRVGKVLGYQVIVCDAREAFATRRRFPLADEIVVDWPHRYLDGIDPPLQPRDAVCLLTHDAKFDVPAIMTAFDSAVGYIGALGGRRTAESRRAQLVDAGATPHQLTRLRAPIGLDLGGRTPEETAVSIAAEIIATRTSHSARPLTEGAGPLHS